MTALAWIGVGLLAWLVLSFSIALVIGRGIATADERCCPHDDLDDDAPRYRWAEGELYL